MFDDLRPHDVPAPPPGAMAQAVHRGTGIRRRRRAAWAGGVAAAVVLGIVVVLGNPFGTPDSPSVVPAATVTATPPPDYSLIPVNPTEQKDGVSFGYLQDITENADGSLTLLIQPGWFLQGEEAKEANGGEYPLGDVLSGKKEGTEPTEFRLDPKATVKGANVLLFMPDGDAFPEGKQITVAQMVKNWKGYQEEFGNAETDVWFRRSSDGSISSLSEQFVS
ncbi:hypothetical protein [Kineosporia succinea]|uniref:Uncharacterized protein n=1 Tax=Kineosporia succinea TaxID=84632 RepID=A0ABT9P1S8_9ACTN|nr:hypothetical protein [Kineosporia succinea]MDP9826628.1 hypothetical protein [Kineosporia succinea]